MMNVLQVYEGDAKCTKVKNLNENSLTAAPTYGAAKAANLGANLPDASGYTFQLAQRSAGDDQARALFSKGIGDTLSDALASAGNDRDFSVKPCSYCLCRHILFSPKFC